MHDRIPVIVHSTDPVLEAGVSASLRSHPEVWLVEYPQPERATVAVVATDEIDDRAVEATRSLQRTGCRSVVLVAGRIDDNGLLAAVEAGVCGLLRRCDATGARLAGIVQAAAAGEGTLPPDLLGRLLHQVGSLQRQVLSPRGLTFGGLTAREISVLKLVAEGHDTSEIAEELAYSQRTIKNVLHDVTTRLNLRNRTHAVAYALREGLI
ncbi:MAG: helix-turn-helix transcriptional regulator [Actinomycetota bacterium]